MDVCVCSIHLVWDVWSEEEEEEEEEEEKDSLDFGTLRTIRSSRKLGVILDHFLSLKKLLLSKWRTIVLTFRIIFVFMMPERWAHVVLSFCESKAEKAVIYSAKRRNHQSEVSTHTLAHRPIVRLTQSSKDPGCFRPPPTCCFSPPLGVTIWELYNSRLVLVTNRKLNITTKIDLKVRPYFYRNNCLPSNLFMIREEANYRNLYPIRKWIATIVSVCLQVSFRGFCQSWLSEFSTHIHTVVCVARPLSVYVAKEMTRTADVYKQLLTIIQYWTLSFWQRVFVWVRHFCLMFAFVQLWLDWTWLTN